MTPECQPHENGVDEPTFRIRKEHTVPRYDYKCDTCRKKYELLQSFSAESSHVCEKCGKGTATRVLSLPAIVFKGSGFYVNDKGGSKSTTDVPESSKTASKKAETTAKSETSSSDSKSKPKSESKSSSSASDAAAS